MMAAKSLVHEHLATWTGYKSNLFGGQGRLNTDRLIRTYTPIIIGAIASRMLGRYVNPAIKRLPFIGGKIKL